MILGNRQFIEIPGSKTHELPPLLVRTRPGKTQGGPRAKRSTQMQQVLKMATELVEQDDLVPFLPLHPEDFDPETAAAQSGAESERKAAMGQSLDPAVGRDLEQRRLGMALHLAEQYMAFVAHWRWGYDVLEWIRQCETTFEGRAELRNLLRADLWPHAGRSSFVTLLADKRVVEEEDKSGHGKVDLEKAVGLRLTFRQPPPLSCISNQFLIYLRGSLAETAYQKWAGMGSPPVGAFPPERFRFDVLKMDLD